MDLKYQGKYKDTRNVHVKNKIIIKSNLETKSEIWMGKN